MRTCGPTAYRSITQPAGLPALRPDPPVAELHGLRVTVAQNITDLGPLADDAEIDPSCEAKGLAQATVEGRSAFDIARFYQAAFHEDWSLLNLRPADHNLGAGECIPAVLTLISNLLASGNTCPTEDTSVFFDAAAFPPTSRSGATGSATCALAIGSTRRAVVPSGSTPTRRCARVPAPTGKWCGTRSGGRSRPGTSSAR